MIEAAEFAPRTIVGKRATFISASHPNSNAPQVIGPLWAEMSRQFFGLSLADNDNPVGVGAMWATESGVEGEMIYFAGYEVSQVADEIGDLEVLGIEAGRFAFVTHTGPMQALTETVVDFYSRLLPNANVERRAGVDLEIYHEGESGHAGKVVIAAPIV
jgi:predicted transcriptional regulator YdeE